MKNPLESVWWCVVALYAVLFVHERDDKERNAPFSEFINSGNPPPCTEGGAA